MNWLLDRAPEVRCDLWTRMDLRSRDAAVSYYRFIAETVLDPFPIRVGFGDESDAVSQNPDDEAGVREWIETANRGGISVGQCDGERANFTLSFARGGIGRLIPCIYTTVQCAPDDPNRVGNRVLNALESLLAKMPLDFARICMRDEWVEKNAIHNYVEDDGLITSWKVFGQDLNTMFPGVYWATYIGMDLAKWAGCTEWKLKHWHNFNPLSGGYLLVRSPTIKTWKDERKADRELVEVIGPDRVFNKAKLPCLPTGPELPVPEFAQSQAR